MTRLSIVLLMAVLASALYLVHVQYESRQLFTAMEVATAEAHRLEVERGRLQVEQRAQATPLRVEKLARDQLNMRTTTPATTLYVQYQEGTAPVVVPSPAPVPPPVLTPPGVRR
ncbi:MAG: cell division protein FtsL [Pseudomonadota bacterium]